MLMEHAVRTKDNSISYKKLPRCNCPLAGVGVVNGSIADMAAIDLMSNRLKLIGLVNGVTSEETAANSGVPFDISALQV